MKFSKAVDINEVVDMTRQKLPESWAAAKMVWNKLASLDKVYPMDHEGFISFERFFSSFMEKNDREPTIPEVVNLYLDNIPKYKGTDAHI